MRVPHLLGRLLFGGYFIASGINHFRHTRCASWANLSYYYYISGFYFS